VVFTINDTAAADPTVGNYFIVDDVSLSGVVGINENGELTTAIEKLQPNPSNETSFIYYSLKEAGNIEFSLSDLTGKIYQHFSLASETAGRHKTELNTSAIPAGNYILVMSTASGRRTIPLTVVH
jgi:hypothetical protein